MRLRSLKLCLVTRFLDLPAGPFMITPSPAFATCRLGFVGSSSASPARFQPLLGLRHCSNPSLPIKSIQPLSPDAGLARHETTTANEATAASKVQLTIVFMMTHASIELPQKNPVPRRGRIKRRGSSTAEFPPCRVTGSPGADRPGAPIAHSAESLRHIVTSLDGIRKPPPKKTRSDRQGKTDH